MAVSNEKVICPYCKKEHSKNKVIGTSGLINYCGSEMTIACEKCGKDFICNYIVSIKYKTTKYVD